MKLSVDTVTPCIQCANESFWVHYVLRDLLKVFPKVLVLDTGSEDNTVEIIKATAADYPNCQLTLMEEQYNKDSVRIGNGRNVMREACSTHFMFIVDGDEIWREDKLHNLLNQEVQDGIDVVMVAGWNVEDVGGKLMLRTHDLANRDGLFSPNIHWHRTDYPFESYGLHDVYLPAGKVQYFPARECFAWHMRHTLRSPKNWETYFRKDKLNYYPYGGTPTQTFEDMPEGWLGEIDCRFTNPYLC